MPCLRQLTSDTPFSAKLVVDKLDDRANHQSGELRTSVEKTNLGRVGLSEISVPGIESLKTRDKRAIVCCERDSSCSSYIR